MFYAHAKRYLVSQKAVCFEYYQKLKEGIFKIWFREHPSINVEKNRKKENHLTRDLQRKERNKSNFPAW